MQVWCGMISSLQKWYPSLPMNHTMLRKATIGKGLINKGMFPIMGFETQHGFLNLIPSSKTPKLEQLCAKQIAEQAYSIKDLNNLIVPKYCLMLIKMEFIRYHYLRTYGYPDMFLSKVYGE